MYTQPTNKTCPCVGLKPTFSIALYTRRNFHSLSLCVWTHFQELNALVLLTYLATVSFLIHVVPTCLPTSTDTFVFQCHSVYVPAFAAHVARILLLEMYRRPFPAAIRHSVNHTTVLVQRRNKIQTVSLCIFCYYNIAFRNKCPSYCTGDRDIRETCIFCH